MLCKCLTLLGERLQPKLLLKNWIFKRKAIWSLADDDDLFKDLQEQLDKRAAYNLKCLPEGTNANDIVSVDDSHKHWAISDDTILCEVLDEEGSETEDDTWCF